MRSAVQQIIGPGGAPQVTPGNTDGRDCEWCGKPAKRATQLVAGRKRIGTGQYIYTCIKHEHLAQKIVAPPERKKAA